MFHHDPAHSDEQLEEMEPTRASSAAATTSSSRREGVEIELGVTRLRRLTELV